MTESAGVTGMAVTGQCCHEERLPSRCHEEMSSRLSRCQCEMRQLQRKGKVGQERLVEKGGFWPV